MEHWNEAICLPYLCGKYFVQYHHLNKSSQLSLILKMCHNSQNIKLFENTQTTGCQRPYHTEHTASRPISAVKQCWVWSVLGWVTAWEHQMPLAFSFPLSSVSLIFPKVLISFPSDKLKSGHYLDCQQWKCVVNCFVKIIIFVKCVYFPPLSLL